MDKERSKAPRRAGLEGGNRFESASPSHRDIRLSDSSRSGTEREPCSPKTDKRVNIGHFLCILRFPLLSPFTQHSLFPHAFADDWCARINQSAVENGKSPKDEMSITIEGGVGSRHCRYNALTEPGSRFSIAPRFGLLPLNHPATCPRIFDAEDAIKNRARSIGANAGSLTSTTVKSFDSTSSNRD